MAIFTELFKELKDTLLENKSTGFKFVGNIVACLILYGFEELLEKKIPCPCERRFNNTYTGLFFSVPFFSLFFISLLVQLGSDEWKEFKKCFKSEKCFFLLFQALLSPLMWTVILFLDGDYLACSKFMNSNETVTSETCGEFNCRQNPSKVPPDLRDICYKSRFIGTILFFVTVIVVTACYCSRYYCCYEPENQETQTPSSGNKQKNTDDKEPQPPSSGNKQKNTDDKEPQPPSSGIEISNSNRTETENVAPSPHRDHQNRHLRYRAMAQQGPSTSNRNNKLHD